MGCETCVREMKNVHGSLEHMCFFFLIDQYAPTRRSSEFVLHLLEVLIIAFVSVAPVIDC